MSSITKVTGESSIIQLEKDKTRSKCHKWQFKAVCRHIGKANLPGITPEMLDDMYIAMLKEHLVSGQIVSFFPIVAGHKLVKKY